MAEIEPLTAFTNDQLADLARAEALGLWREHRKLELVAGAIAAPVSAFLVGSVVYILGGASQGIPYGTIIAAIVAAGLGAAITLVIIYGYYRFIEAPSNLYFETHERVIYVQHLLEEEKAKNAAPKLAGRI